MPYSLIGLRVSHSQTRRKKRKIGRVVDSRERIGTKWIL